MDIHLAEGAQIQAVGSIGYVAGGGNASFPKGVVGCPARGFFFFFAIAGSVLNNKLQERNQSGMPGYAVFQVRQLQMAMGVHKARTNNAGIMRSLARIVFDNINQNTLLRNFESGTGG